MACMTHECTNPKCQHAVFNNNSRSPSSCPKCGERMLHLWDEDPADYSDRDDDRGDRDQDRDDD